MVNEHKPGLKARNVGAGVMLIVIVVIAGVWAGKRKGLWEERYLVVATVADPGELAAGSPVYFKGVEIGEVVKIRPPEEDRPGFKIRMAAQKAAFKHISLDSPVRVDRGKPGHPYRITILPGRHKPDWYYPGNVKVLREVSKEEDTVRLIRDVLDGLVNLSRAKATEAQMLELREELRRLRQELENLEKKKLEHIDHRR